MVRYEVVKTRPLLASRDSCGMICKEEQDGRWVTVAAVAPFSDDFAAVSRLAEACTALQLSPEHLLDAVSDFIVLSATTTCHDKQGLLTSESG